MATSAKAQVITGHFADKIAALSKHLSDQERVAAIQQIKLEEAAALANMYRDAMREGEQQRRAVVGPIRARHRGASAALSRRQRSERIALGLALRMPRSAARARLRPRAAVRRVAFGISDPRST
jgi:hypothetical protein